MKKLTDPDYRLPIAEALGAFDLFETGTTTPMAVWAVDTLGGSRGQYVVKFKHANRMSILSSTFELIGAWMAIELGLPAVEPALINISAEFVEIAMKGRDGYKAALQSQGLNFGTVYKAGYTYLPPRSLSLNDDLIDQIKLLYVFDNFISNADRGHQRPNVAFNGQKMLIFDHELAFSFISLLPSLRNPKPWLLNDSDRETYANHHFYPLLKSLDANFEEQAHKLKCIDEGFWLKLKNTIPAEWLTDEIHQIEVYLSSIIRNIDTFASSLNKTIYK